MSRRERNLWQEVYIRTYHTWTEIITGLLVLLSNAIIVPHLSHQTMCIIRKFKDTSMHYTRKFPDELYEGTDVEGMNCRAGLARLKPCHRPLAG